MKEKLDVNDFTIQKLGDRISELQVMNAKLEFQVIALTQKLQELQETEKEESEVE